jgi:long-chain fatty acid transport protein
MLGRTFFSKLCLLTCLLIPTFAHASATYLYNMYSAVAVGDAGSGGAALANDASTAYSNPAGMMRIKKPELVVSATDVNTTATFDGSTTWSIPGFGSYLQTGKANGGANRLLPELYIVFPASQFVNLGFSFTAPYGLGTYYSPDSIMRYSAGTSELKVLDLSPNIAFRINDQWSLGAGMDIDKFTIRLSADAGVPTIDPALDATSHNDVGGWAYGWHAGVLYQLTQNTRFGLSYRSQVDCDMTGKSMATGGVLSLLSGGATDSVSDSNLATTYILPPTTTLSAFHAFNNKWAAQASLTYIQWSELKDELILNNVANLPSSISVALPQYYRNTWTVAGGFSYQPFNSWLIRSGIFWDQTPVTSDSNRTANLPDSDRTGLSVGTHYQATKTVGLDFGYTHIFFATADIDNDAVFGSQTSNANGEYNNHADLFAAQLTWDIG